MKFTSLIYGAATGIKRFLYAKGIRKKELMPSFVISVGNISAGGTGKTAFVIDLCRMLAGKKRTAVVTRGYKGKTKGPAQARRVEKATELFGDEAVMMAEKLAPAPVIVSKNRIEGIKFARKNFKSDVCLLDDAFQNFTMEKDRDIVLVDALAPWRGLLREGKRSLRRADMVIISKSNLAGREAAETLREEIRSFTKAAIIVSELTLKYLTDLKTSENISPKTLENKEIGAFCGIGKPGSFRKLLEKNGIALKRFLSFGDHHAYKQANIDGLDKNLTWLTTEKDAVKLKGLSHDGILSVETESSYSEDIMKIIFPGGGTNKAVILDRDGTLNADPGYVVKTKDMKLFPETIPALKKLSNAGYILIIVSNQSGIGRGYYSLNKVKKFNKALTDKLAANGIKISGIYLCPHSPEEECACRKPETLLFEKAIGDFGIDVNKSWCIGDKITDVEGAKKVNIRGILLGRDFKNLNDAADYILKTTAKTA